MFEVTVAQIGGSMRIGTDGEGRVITYDESTNQFAIADIATTLEKVIAYDRGGQVKWDSHELQKWAYDAEVVRQSHVQQEQVAQAQAQQQAAAVRAEESRLRSLVVQGYDANTSVRLAGALNGVATFIVVAFIFVGVSNGLILGVLLAEQTSVGLLVFPILFGLLGWFIGWLSILLIRVIAQGLLTVTQIEANTRRN